MTKEDDIYKPGECNVGLGVPNVMSRIYTLGCVISIHYYFGHSSKFSEVSALDREFNLKMFIWGMRKCPP